MKRFGIMGAAFVAACLLSAVAAAGAWATNPPGPLWLLLLPGGNEMTLGAGESLEIEATNLSPSPYGSTQEFLGGNVYIECPMVAGTGNIKGGNPGTDEATITFSECKTGKLNSGTKGSVEACNAHTSGAAAGEIVVPVKTELVYIGTKAEAEKGEPPVGDLFSPASGTTFVTIEFTVESGGSCPIAGNLIVTGNAVAKISEAHQLWGELNFPASRIKEYYSTSSSTAHTASLKSASGTVTDTQIGTAGVMLTNGDEFGVKSK